MKAFGPGGDFSLAGAGWGQSHDSDPENEEAALVGGFSNRLACGF